MSGLAAGQTYQFQWWSNGSVAPFANDLTTATAGNSVVLNLNTSGATGGLGQFATGTFVADGTNTQIITFSNNNFAAIDGFQLRNLSPASAVPEPGSALAGLLALGACAGGLLRRRRELRVKS